MHVILQAVVPLFALIFAGFLVGRYRILGADAVDSLNKFVVWMALPALLFQAMAQISWEQINQPGYVGAFGLATLAVFGLSFLADRRAGKSLSEASVDALAGAYANAGFMGIPLGLMLFGQASLPPVIIATLSTACVLFACSIALVELDRQGGGGLGRTLRKVGLSLLRNPLVAAPALGIATSASGLPVPDAVFRFTDLLGAAAAPCALVTIGLFLAQSQPAGNAGTLVWRMVALKLVVHPLLVFVLAHWVFDMPAMWASVAVLLSALPIGTGPFMVAKLYNLNAAAASRAILLSTVLSLFTVSILVAWLAPAP